MTTKASLSLHARIRPSWCPEWCPWPLPMPGDTVTVSGTDYTVGWGRNKQLVLIDPSRKYGEIPIYAKDIQRGNPEHWVSWHKSKPYLDYGIPTMVTERGSSFIVTDMVGPDADGIAKYIKALEAHSEAVARSEGYDPDMARFKALMAMI